jgi:hypothetical protein
MACAFPDWSTRSLSYVTSAHTCNSQSAAATGTAMTIAPDDRGKTIANLGSIQEFHKKPKSDHGKDDEIDFISVEDRRFLETPSTYFATKTQTMSAR